MSCGIAAANAGACGSSIDPGTGRTLGIDIEPWRQAVIDADVHSVVASVEVLFSCLTEHWREYITQSAFEGPVVEIR